MSLGDALICEQAPIPPDVARSSNRSRAMLAATGQSAAEWLESRGWVMRGKRWASSVSGAGASIPPE
jgi:hypothetical protein